MPHTTDAGKGVKRVTRKNQVHTGRVVCAEWITPHMRRVVLGGEGLKEFAPGISTDLYVKLLFPVEGVTYPEPFDIAAIRESLPRDQWPKTRTYTVRSWDPVAQRMVLDFVHHGDEGLAGPWAAAAGPGTEIRFLGPGGGYRPDGAADWHLLVGDESVLPAIAASVQTLPAAARVRVCVEVPGQEDQQELTTDADDIDIAWIHRGSARVGAALVKHVQAMEFPSGRVHAFVHGEANFVKELRRHLLLEREIGREQLSISGYWRLGANEDDWQAAKADWNRQVEREQGAAASTDTAITT